MCRKLLLSLIFVIVSIFLAISADAQTTRNSISGAEATGTFRYYFSGRYKGSYDEIKILPLGKGRVRVSFDLLYPHLDGSGEMTANMGNAEGEATISGDTAVYSTGEDGDECTITIKFVKPGTIKVSQDGICGFGFNVSANGTYKKVSGAKPKFE